MKNADCLRKADTACTLRSGKGARSACYPTRSLRYVDGGPRKYLGTITIKSVVSPQCYTWYGAYRAANQALLYDASPRVKDADRPLKPILHVPYAVGRGGEECLLPDDVSEIRCRRAK